jgi:hypothetical protein
VHDKITQLVTKPKRHRKLIYVPGREDMEEGTEYENSVILDHEGQLLRRNKEDVIMGIDVDPLEPQSNHVYSRQCAFFIIHISDQPASSDRITLQKSDYILDFATQEAENLLSFRPLNRFVTGVMIHNGQFRIGLFSRCGISLSPVYQLKDDIFLRLMQRLTCDLSEIELGFDETVTIQDTFYGSEYPQFAIPPQSSSEVVQTTSFEGFEMTSSREALTTVGIPLWVSLSLLGPGISLWKCTDGSMLQVSWSFKSDISSGVFVRLLLHLG